ncbi:cyclin-dependent kinase G-2-like [Cynara cardunculus var. scolymus]|uniref:cyclin-dependent kinase n=1 Tax=Cynara cardunculus var. scolymus TaxID=59895 RepID=A0A103YBR1_CYNCS|nr:cyclin-dependent kinase G-2-like [Cynara cardunculus var. scolymus]KVI06173.1 Protein kinase, catalytic domain-containing protein [Cynara cardunculus var. scolymus]
MAAGRQNISRKRYSNHSEEENPSYKIRYNQRTSASGLDLPKNAISSGGRTNDHRTNRDVDGDLGRSCWEANGVRWSVLPIDHDLQDRNNEEFVSENESRSVSTKKRKFSPIVWDRVDKQVKISSKNRIISTSSVLSRSSSPKPLKDFVKLQAVKDGKIERCSIDADSELQISPVESLVSNVSDGLGVSCSLATSTHEECDQELENEDGEYMEERNLSKSKWAFNDSPRMASEINNSSPESGEFKRKGFEGMEEVSSLSTEIDPFLAQASEDEQSRKFDDKASSMGYVSSEGDDDECHVTDVPRCIGLGLMPSCRNVFEYERLGKISEGTYGVVYKARDKKTGDIVALKKVKMGKEREGFPVTALREINILGSLQHPSIVEVKEVVMDDFDGVYMVMEYIDHELKGYMERMKQPFSQSEVKCLMLQLLEGLSFLHDNWVIHRDLKTSNLLLNNKGELKICDFGMSRRYGSPIKPYTSLVVTLWYRAPEVLLGMKNYTTAIDMWSVGCIMAELLAKKPLFDGNRELEQINKIFRTLGTPNETIWPGYLKLPGVKPNFVKQADNNLRKRFPVATFTGSPVLTELGFDLLNKLLTYDPKKRITAEEALNHGWFRESPLPAENVRICR